MADFAFEKGGGITIMLGGKVLGGVKKAACSIENSFYDVCEFLSDVPVQRTEIKRYGVELVMNSAEKLDFLQRHSFDALKFCSSKKSVVYSDCFVKSVKADMDAKKEIEYTVKITANGRKEE